MIKTDKAVHFLGGITIDQFLKEYWQKKPLFVKNAFPNFKDPVSPDEIAGYSCEEEIPSRMVLEDGGVRPWELRLGPFKESDFAKLPEKNWVLLLNDFEKFLPQLRSLSDPFKFIPEWRLDDVQVSYAVDGGNVGAHWDDYDVFLIQGMGKKHWRISYDDVSEDDFLKGVDIRLIENFKTDEEWIVEPGDLLYLPPRIGHYGIAIGECLTWSVGFRAPKHHEILDDYTENLVDKCVPKDIRYTDPDLSARAISSEINDDDIDHIMKIIKEGLASNRDIIADWFGGYISEPKAGQEATPLEEPFSLDEIKEMLSDQIDIERLPSLRFYFRETLDEAILYAAGECFALDKKHLGMITYLCENINYSARKLLGFLEDSVCAEFMLDLINQGFICFYDEHDECGCDDDCDCDHE